VPRTAQFDERQILDAAERMIARDGPAAATIRAIAQALGAPTGSIYHRFASRDVLLAEVWLACAAAFQDGYYRRLRRAGDATAAGREAALYMAERVRERPREARVLLLHRREDFVERAWPAAMRRRAAVLGEQVRVELCRFAERLCGRRDAVTLRGLAYALLEAPLAAVKRHVEANEPPPPDVDQWILLTYDAVIARLKERMR
jgi:AcrR family transcriptional regulator